MEELHLAPISQEITCTMVVGRNSSKNCPGGGGHVSNSRLWIYPCISGLADGSAVCSLETMLLRVSNDVRQVFSLFSVYRRIAGVLFAGCVCYADDVVPCQSALHVMLNITAHVFNTKKILIHLTS